MYDFFEGQMLLINKPKEWTSFDVVNKVRNVIRRKYEKKLKVGHAGTLDPLASGLLILCTGKMTKKIADFSGLDKEYIAEITFGATTPTYDLEAEPDTFFDKEHITEDLLNYTLAKFIGKQNQSPPIFSAKKINGQKAYEIARKGKDFEMKKVEVEFKEIQLLEHNLPNNATIRLKVSKGTYIRSFAFDLGQKLNSGAYLSDLIRTKIGDYNLNEATELNDFQEKVNNIII
ncbi:MAG: tRNA pseudouridine(55) synthase TruB [Bacteroidales bacterium]|nr:tRNA pseudouridine(55) synthase TruB [Bacteroidales bacterium]